MHLLKYFALCLLLICLFHPATPAAQQINRVAAVVNGEMITLYDLHIQASQEFFRQGLTGMDSYSEAQRQTIMREVLDSMIMDILIRQDAERYKVIVDEKEVDNNLRMFMQSNNFTQEELEQRLRLEGSSLAELRKKLRDNILRQRMINLMIERKADITPRDIERYYNEHLDRFTTPSSVALSLIIFEPGDRPEAVRDQIALGQLDFAEAARRYSHSPTAALGGSLGDIPWRDLNPSWREALEGLKPGQLSALLRNGDITVLLRVDALRASQTQSLEEVAGQIEEELREPKLRERIAEYTEQLRGKSLVDIRI